MKTTATTTKIPVPVDENTHPSPYSYAGVSITPEQVITEWEKHFKIKFERILWRDKSTDSSFKRHVLCYALYNYASVNKRWIGERVKRTRGNVYHSVRTVEGLLDDPRYSGQIHAFIDIIAELPGSDRNVDYTIPVQIDRHDLRVLIPEAGEWKLEHWNLQSLWNLYQQKKMNNNHQKKGSGRTITGNSTLT